MSGIKRKEAGNPASYSETMIYALSMNLIDAGKSLFLICERMTKDFGKLAIDYSPSTERIGSSN